MFILKRFFFLKKIISFTRSVPGYFSITALGGETVLITLCGWQLHAHFD